MKLVDIPYQCFFRKIDKTTTSNEIYLKPNVSSVVVSHVLCHNKEGKNVYLDNNLDVEIVDKISNFD